MLELIAPRFDWSAVALAAGVAALAGGPTTTRTPIPRICGEPAPVAGVRVVAAPACDRATRAPRSYFKPLGSASRSYELHHIDELGFVDLDCDGVIDYTARHVAPSGPELVISSYLHRERFYDYRIPLGTGACEASVDVDERAVEIVVTHACEHRIERYAIRENRLYLDGRFLRGGT